MKKGEGGRGVPKERSERERERLEELARAHIFGTEPAKSPVGRLEPPTKTEMMRGIHPVSQNREGISGDGREEKLRKRDHRFNARRSERVKAREKEREIEREKESS